MADLLVTRVRKLGFEEMHAWSDPRNIASVKNLMRQMGEGTLAEDGNLHFKMNL